MTFNTTNINDFTSNATAPADTIGSNKAYLVLKLGNSLTNGTSPIDTESVPSLASSAMLVELSISAWRGSKLAKRESEEVTQRANAGDRTARVTKSLLPDCEELKAIHTHINAIRAYNNSATMPWGNMGQKLLATKGYPTYHNDITGMIAEGYRLVDAFCQSYDWKIADAQASLGDMFDSNDYPSVDDIRRKFVFRLSYQPLPDAGDFRIDIGNEAMRDIQERYNSFYETCFKQAMGDVWQRVYKALSNASERLDYSDTEDKRVFRDSLVGNIMGLVDVLDVCNVTNDTQMSALRQQLQQAFEGITADALRDDEYLRRETKTNVDAIIAQLPSIEM